MSNVFVIGEIGINHNGDMQIARQLIESAKRIGCDAVKFQKRTINKVYSEAYLDSYRESPWGTTQREQKEGLEFSEEEYHDIDCICRKTGIDWFASAWDYDSQIFLRQFELKYNKVASAMISDSTFLEMVADEQRYTFVSTGMCSLDEIDRAVEIFRRANCPFELMHCNSTYPMDDADANLSLIPFLRDRYSCKVGYSGHEKGIIVSYTAAVMGASSLERHITLDRDMYGSDQKASLETGEMETLIHCVRNLPVILGDGNKIITEKEAEIRRKLVR